MNDSFPLPKELLMIDAEENCVDQSGAFENSDSRLVAQTITGDEAAYEMIFDRYKKLVAVIASRYFRRPEQIEEIIQITFAKAFFELKTFRGEHDFSLATWLGKIATNSCLDALKSRSRKPENLLSELSEIDSRKLLETLESPKADAENRLINRDLAEKLLEHLPTADRALLQMLYAEEMSVGEIARITGLSQSNVKIKAFRARRALRKFLRKLL